MNQSAHDIDLYWLGDVALQATFVLLFSLLALIPRLSASRRHLIFSAALLSIPALMLGTGLGPAWRLYTPAPVMVVAAPESAAPVVSALPADPFAEMERRLPTAPAKSATTKASPAHSAMSWADALAWSIHIAFWVWLLGIAAGMGMLALSAIRIRQLRSRSTLIEQGRIRQLFLQCLGERGLESSRIQLLAGPENSVPMTWGLWRHYILLPKEAEQWQDARALLVLRHELAHIARRDLPVSLCTTLSALLLWFHPLVWLVRRASNQAREAACDDMALAQSDATPEAFATELLQAISQTGCVSGRLFTPLALAMAGSDKRLLKKRLASLLDDSQSREPWGRKSLCGISGVAAVVTLIFTGLSACRQEPAAPAKTAFKGKQVQINSKVFTVPINSPVLAEFEIQVNPASGIPVGVIDEAKAQLLIKRLQEVKDVHLLSAPNVVVKYGQESVVEMVREFIYPTEFDPPQLPDAKDLKPFTMKPGEALPVFPTTPTAFETRNVGLRMQFKTEIDAEGTIDLNITTEFTNFEGFINYGNPIKGNAMGNDGALHEINLSDNNIKQPVFHTSKWSTSVSLRDGDYLVMGGLGAKSSDARADLKKPDMTAANMVNNESRDLVFFVIHPINMVR